MDRRVKRFLGNGQRQPHKGPPQRGFTLVELLVVIAIIGILVALLLPAVQAARESARRMQCVNQLKQLGVALHNHHSAKGEFPPGGVSLSKSPDKNFTNWAIELLPYIERQPLYDQYDHTAENNDPVNRPVLETEFDLMKCPSDMYAQENDGSWALGSYKGMAGVLHQTPTGDWLNWCIWLTTGGTSMYVGHEQYDDYRGLLHVTGLGSIKAEKFKNVTDGTSRTLAIGEYHATGDFANPVWWARTWRYRNKAEGLADPLLRRTDRQLCRDHMAIAPLWVCNRQFGTTHAGDGGNWLKIDGSVDFITATVDGEVYESMCTIAGQDEFGFP